MPFPGRPEVEAFLEGVPRSLRDAYWENCECWMHLDKAVQKIVEGEYPSRQDMEDLKTAHYNLQASRKKHLGEVIKYHAQTKPDEEDLKKATREAVKQRGKVTERAVQKGSRVDTKKSTYGDVPPMGEL